MSPRTPCKPMREGLGREGTGLGGVGHATLGDPTSEPGRHSEHAALFFSLSPQYKSQQAVLLGLSLRSHSLSLTLCLSNSLGLSLSLSLSLSGKAPRSSSACGTTMMADRRTTWQGVKMQQQEREREREWLTRHILRIRSGAVSGVRPVRQECDCGRSTKTAECANSSLPHPHPKLPLTPTQTLTTTANLAKLGLFKRVSTVGVDWGYGCQLKIFVLKNTHTCVPSLSHTREHSFCLSLAISLLVFRGVRETDIWAQSAAVTLVKHRGARLAADFSSGDRIFKVMFFHLSGI